MADEGESALVLVVEDAESVVGRWRASGDPSASQGMPAHVTVLYPFLPRERIDSETLAAVEVIASRRTPIVMTFASFGEFPDVLWIDPASGECRRLVEAVGARWPRLTPYGVPGLEVIPHLTVLDGAGHGTICEAREEIGGRLPFSTVVSALTLMAFRDNRWRVERTFEFGAAVSEGKSSFRAG